MTAQTIADIARRFATEGASHAMEVVHDDGLYRHLRFRHQVWRPPLAQPQTSGWFWFDLITVPGTLIFQGDGYSYVFSRLEDMFEFFRVRKLSHIDPHYWSEKLTTRDGRDGTKDYDETLFATQVREAVAEATADGRLPGLAEAVERDVFESGEYRFSEAEARRVLDQFSYYEDERDRYALGHRPPDFTFDNAWEWDLRDYSWWFLWACHAIVWGIALYDAHKAGRDRPVFPVQPVAPGATAAPSEAARPARSMTTAQLPGDGA